MAEVFNTFADMIDNLITEDVHVISRSEQVIQMENIARNIGADVDRVVDQYLGYVYREGFSGIFEHPAAFKPLSNDWEYRKTQYFGGMAPSFYRGKGYWLTGKNSLDEWVEEKSLNKADKLSANLGHTKVTLYINNRVVETNPHAAAWKVRYKHSVKDASKRGAAAKLHGVPMRIELEILPGIFGAEGSVEDKEKKIIAALQMPDKQKVKILGHGRLFLSEYLDLYYISHIHEVIRRIL